MPVPGPGQSLEGYCEDAIVSWIMAGARGEKFSDLQKEIAALNFARQIRKILLKERI